MKIQTITRIFMSMSITTHLGFLKPGYMILQFLTPSNVFFKILD